MQVARHSFTRQWRAGFSGKTARHMWLCTTQCELTETDVTQQGIKPVP